ncbi:MAG: FIST C-terminal domain-containing protein [Plectolyngbya sp. WJT66-NPBG17]|jgi:small ligand-binding sensory domain FIST|nr:FIST C-terminal domain-containing protein [Plectolyngbya sp. WJT66-NPBG17]
MRWASALSTRPFLEAAVEEVVSQAQAILQASADLGFVFISSAFASEYSRLLPLLRDKLPGVSIVGCSGGGIVGMTQRGKAREVEEEPALSLVLAHLPEVQIKPFYVSASDLPDLDSPPDTWTDLIGVSPAESPNFVLLADLPRVNDLLQGLDFAYPGAAKVGGLASSGMLGSGATGLFCDDRFYREGAVGVALSGNIVLDTIVAQGCRPIGQPYWVTEGERNILLAMQEDDGSGLPSDRCAVNRSPLEQLQDLVQNLNEDDRQLAQQNHIFIGVAQNGFKQTLEPGDFLIRNLLGVDPRVGAIAIGDLIRPGQRIQFHLRDAETSGEDLDLLLRRYVQASQSNPSAIGALMFSCLGRGEGLYGEPNFDSQLVNEYLEDLPIAGFFCNGEIGPVGGSTFLHGYTSVFGIYREKK